MSTGDDEFSSEQFSLEGIKSRWNEVLDALLEVDRIGWLAFFDARLVRLENSILTITFVDVTKMGGEHNFRATRNPRYLSLLKDSIREITGIELEIVEE